MIIINKIEDFSKMFKNCSRLIGIRGNIDVSNGNDFSEMFCGCESLFDIEQLKNWNVSKGHNFNYMFYDVLWM